MGRHGGVSGATSDAARRGLWRLMLKLPAMRGRLQIFAAHSHTLDELFEAYEIAAVALDGFHKARDCLRVMEYENLCSGIEADVIEHILRAAPDGSE